jgi:lipoprotein-anchoring transpeptidase ErfK/SrfK
LASPLRLQLVLVVLTCGLSCARQEPPGALAGVTSNGLDEEPAPTSVAVALPAASVAPARGKPKATAPAPSGSAGLVEGELPIGPAYEVGEEGGVSVAAIARPVWIYDGPEQSTHRLGYLNPGMVVRRAEQPVAITRRCRAGWYRVAPRGFLCMNPTEVTADLSHPVAVSYVHQARRGDPLPYLYGRVRSAPPALYGKAPSRLDQRVAEDDLNEHLEKVSSQTFVPGPLKPEPLPATLAQGAWLPKAQNVVHRRQRGAIRGFANPRSSFAIFSIHDIGGRLFGLSTDLDLIALDRLRLVQATRIHGGPITDLPAGLPLRAVPKVSFDDQGHLSILGAFDAYEPLSLTGQLRDEYAETVDHEWAPQKALHPFKKRTNWPGFLKDGDEMKWVDVSIRDQTLVAYEGHRAVFVTRVSTGADGEGDPETTNSTIQGMYRVQNKHVTTTMTGRQSESDYELSDVPYVQYFHHSYALHAAFWHEDFGHPHSHGCINLAPKDASWLFEWTDPKLPTEWHGVESNGEGTLIFIHP